MPVDWIGFGYAAAVALGGFMGYKRKGSVMSLIAGLLFGSLSAFGAYRLSIDPRDVKVSLGEYGGHLPQHQRGLAVRETAGRAGHTKRKEDVPG
ncbi:TM14C protein, partial [Atractosteus spatula]|nr:TM14C protein [Atractosteus spatula]